jgi:sugar phosphate isomerase/epimerase
VTTISLFSQSLFALDLERAIEGTATLGFDAIELACHRPHFDLETARRTPERVARRIEQAGLTVSALSGFNTFTEPRTLNDELTAAETIIRLAPLFGTEIVKLTPGAPGSAEAASAHWQCLEQTLTALIPLARQVGVRLAFETHMRQLTDTLASSEQLLEMTPADVVGLTVDYSNLVFAGEDITQVIPHLADRTFNTHLKNGTVDADGRWHFHALDEGWTDNVLVLRMLRDARYDGPLTIECLAPEARKHPLHVAGRDLAILKRILGHVGWDRESGEIDERQAV